MCEVGVSGLGTGCMTSSWVKVEEGIGPEIEKEMLGFVSDFGVFLGILYFVSVFAHASFGRRSPPPKSHCCQQIRVEQGPTLRLSYF